MSRSALFILSILSIVLSGSTSAHPPEKPCEVDLDSTGEHDINQILTGKFPILPGLEFEDQYFTQGIFGFAQVPPLIRQVMQTIERESLSHPDMLFREYGALFIHFADGSVEILYKTANDPLGISRPYTTKAILDSRLLHEAALGRIPRMVVDFHTHPGREYRVGTRLENIDVPLAINRADYMYYEHISDLLSTLFGQVIPIEGVVVPMCANCNEVFFKTSAKPNQHRIYPGEIQRMVEALERVKASLAGTPTAQ